MMGGMAGSAKPFNIKWLFVVLVVGLGFLVATIGAWESFYFPLINRLINNSSGANPLSVTSDTGSMFFRIIFYPVLNVLSAFFVIFNVINPGFYAKVCAVTPVIFPSPFVMHLPVFSVLSSSFIEVARVTNSYLPFFIGDKTVPANAAISFGYHY